MLVQALSENHFSVPYLNNIASMQPKSATLQIQLDELLVCQAKLSSNCTSLSNEISSAWKPCFVCGGPSQCCLRHSYLQLFHQGVKEKSASKV